MSGPPVAADREIEELLRLVYVGGGFTDPESAEDAFRASAVRARGRLLEARDAAARLIGMAITVFPGSPACRFAAPGEAELQLLAVHPEHQGQGIGSSLVDASIAAARAGGASRMLLWTQPSMTGARRLYDRRGFLRVPELDFSRGARRFEVLARPI